MGVLAQLCAPDKNWRSFGPWLQKTVMPEHWVLPAHLLVAQNFWHHRGLLMLKIRPHKTKQNLTMRHEALLWLCAIGVCHLDQIPP